MLAINCEPHMAAADLAGTLRSSDESVALAGQLRRLTRVATVIALLTSPAAYFYFTVPAGTSVSWLGSATHILTKMGHLAQGGQFWMQIVVVFFLFASNFLIFMGPMMLMGISQIRGYEPGDAEWGVKLEHVRGQAEAKEEVRRIVTLWQSGEAFERAGGKRERGLLFLGAPGTGKTMLAKAIATGFNSPFVSIPGSGFAQTFIGIDALIVRFLARKAKKLARKWGGQCIVFIDEIDAVGMRRQALQGQRFETPDFQLPFYGPYGAIKASCTRCADWVRGARLQPARRRWSAAGSCAARSSSSPSTRSSTWAGSRT
jgi:hypothetical protein